MEGSAQVAACDARQAGDTDGDQILGTGVHMKVR
jgi:hypothetical protein